METVLLESNDNFDFWKKHLNTFAANRNYSYHPQPAPGACGNSYGLNIVPGVFAVIIVNTRPSEPESG